MFNPKSAFSGFSVDDQDKAKAFYEGSLGLKVDGGEMGLTIHLPGAGTVFCYPKGEGHQPATFTILNFEVEDIDAAVDDLAGRGVQFERYTEGPGQTDDKGVARGRAANMGPDIAWFKDPAGNILAVLQN
jgi:catechol 2,3-dioxygenase-like lactoylglutathione lyase family enzyme